MDLPEPLSGPIGIDARLYAGNYTGIGVYTRGLVDGLARLEEEQPFLLFTDRPMKSPGDNFSVVSVPVAKRVLWTQLFLPWRTRSVDLCLFHATANYELPLFLRCPSVITVHDIIPLLFPKTVPFRHRHIFRSLIGPAVRKAEVVITDSEFVRRSLSRRFGLPENRLVSIPLAHDPSFEKAASAALKENVRARLGLGGDYVLYFGAMEPRKNLPALISAFARATAEAGLGGWRLVLAGHGGWQKGKILEAARESGLGRRLIITGFIPAEELPALYQEAALFVYPSVYEGFGLPVLEAMASGTPVLVSSPSALEELAGEAGVTFTLEDPEDLYRQLLALMREEDRRTSLSAAVRKRAAAFSWDRTAGETLSLYRRVLRSKGGGS